MVFWNEIDTNEIEFVPWGKDRTRFLYKGKSLRFQIPRGLCERGVSAYESKSFIVSISNPEFFDWWRSLETYLCPKEPFNSNVKSATDIRLKIDNVTYIFDENSKQVMPEIQEGLFRGQELSCIVEIDSTYFFNSTWGLVCRANQVKTYGEEERPDEEQGLQKGVCAFICEQSPAELDAEKTE